MMGLTNYTNVYGLIDSLYRVTHCVNGHLLSLKITHKIHTQGTSSNYTMALCYTAVSSPLIQDVVLLILSLLPLQLW